VRIRENGETRLVNVEVIPLKSLKERSFLILFDDAEKGRALPSTTSREQPRGVTRTLRPVGKKEESRRIAAMERDLSETRDYLQSIQEQHEATNEELQASNEEIQSANEELQSVNEELETSKEELESANEELNTVNEEMATRNIELNRLNSDLSNLQTSTRLAIVLFGRDLTIRRFSPQAEKQFNLMATDIGRPISEVRHNLDLTDLETFIAEVIASIREREREVRDKDGRWYSLRVRPYLTIDNKVDGAVLVLVDIDALKRTELEIIKAREYSDAIIRTVPEPLVILDSGLRVQSANEAFYGTFKLSLAETERRSLLELDHGAWKIPKLQQLLKGIIPGNGFFDDLQVTREFERIGQRTMLLNARPLHQADDKTKLILLGIRDVTELMHFQGAARESEARYRALFEAIDEGFCIIEKVETKPGALSDFRYVVANPAFKTQTGVGDVVGKTIREAFPGEPHDWYDTYEAILRTGKAIRFERDLVTQGRALELYAFRVEDKTQRRVAVLFADITERKRAEQRLLLLKNELAHRGKNLLAVIQSIASRSLSGTRSLPEAREVFTQRIHALARSQSALLTGEFEGASIAEIIRLEFEGFSNRIEAVGPDVMLNPKVAQTFALLVHELATNASKYGALSRPEGQVAIHWSIAGEGADARFKFQWQERDGPPIVPPTRHGFGSTLLEKAAAQDFGALPKINFAPTGLTYEIDAPLSLLVADGTGGNSL
jgi:PAS domain S-box-containing protein